MLHHELVIRQVLIHRLNHIVAVVPGVGDVVIELMPARVGIAGQIEPVPPPAFPEVGRSEQPIDDLLMGIGRLICQERLDRFRRGRQPQRVEVDPANPCPPIRFARRAQPRLFDLREQKTIDRRARPVGVLDGGRRHSVERLKRPALRPPGELFGTHGTEFVPLRRGHSGCSRTRGGPRSTQFDPLHEDSDLLRRQLPVRRHLIPVGLISQGLDQLALIWFPRHDRRVGVAPLQGGLARVESQASLLLLRTVALLAMLHQQWADFLLEELNLLRSKLRLFSPQRCAAENAPTGSEPPCENGRSTKHESPSPTTEPQPPPRASTNQDTPMGEVCAVRFGFNCDTWTISPR